MLEEDRTQIIEVLKLHFTGSTGGDANLLWDMVKNLDLSHVIKAMEDHRLDCGKQAYRPDIRAVYAKAKQAMNQVAAPQRTRFRVCDWIRNENRAKYQGQNDTTVIYVHYQAAWYAVAEDAKLDEYGRQMARAYIKAHAVAALNEIRLPSHQVESLSREIVSLKAGEKITGGRMFRPPPIEPSPRTPEALAQMEHRKQHATS